MVARLIAGDGNRCDRAGARIHDLSHPAWRDDLEILVGECGDRLAFLTLPKAESADDVAALRRCGRACRRAPRARARDSAGGDDRDPRGGPRRLALSPRCRDWSAWTSARSISSAPTTARFPQRRWRARASSTTRCCGGPSARRPRPRWPMRWCRPTASPARSTTRRRSSRTRGAPGTNSASCGCGASTRRRSSRSCARCNPRPPRSPKRPRCWPPRRPPTGRRWPPPASCTIAAPTATSGASSSARTRRAARCPSRRRVLRGDAMVSTNALPPSSTPRPSTSSSISMVR